MAMAMVELPMFSSVSLQCFSSLVLSDLWLTTQVYFRIYTKLWGNYKCFEGRIPLFLYKESIQCGRSSSWLVDMDYQKPYCSHWSEIYDFAYIFLQKWDFSCFSGEWCHSITRGIPIRLSEFLLFGLKMWRLTKPNEFVCNIQSFAEAGKTCIEVKVSEH